MHNQGATTIDIPKACVLLDNFLVNTLILESTATHDKEVNARESQTMSYKN